LAVLVTTVVIAVGSANAQVKPFKVSGGGPAPNGASIFGADSPHSATGNGTQLGKYSGDGIFNALSFDATTLSGTFHGTFTFVAANGDKLACTYGETANGADQPGTYQVVPADGGKVIIIFLAEFNPVPIACTGKFKDVVDGSFLMLAVTEPIDLSIDANGFTPPFHYDWMGDGWLEFKKK
jgi:hypothetical protein